MSKHWVRFYLAGAIWGLLASCAEKKVTLGEYTFKAQPVDLKIDSVADGYRVEGSSAFQLPGHFVWGASVTKAEDGKYYMIYSAPETGIYPFNNAWVFGSKMGLAVSDRPDGGFCQLGFFMN